MGTIGCPVEGNYRNLHGTVVAGRRGVAVTLLFHLPIAAKRWTGSTPLT
jgi:hypothetical protein